MTKKHAYPVPESDPDAYRRKQKYIGPHALMQLYLERLIKRDSKK